MEPLSAKIERFKRLELVPYGELLDTNEWSRKRAEILRKDNNKCFKCGLRPHEDVSKQYISENLHKGFPLYDEELPPMPACHYWPSHVHHTYYILNKLPWEYEEALVTMCYGCHQELHRNETVPVYYEINGDLIQRHFRSCIRCGGAGWFPEYSHVHNGVCFRCGGWGWEELMVIRNRNVPSGI